MTLACWLRCAGCGRRITIGRELEPGKRYRMVCRHCGARINFGAASLRWSFDPTRPAWPIWRHLAGRVATPLDLLTESFPGTG